MAELTDYEPSVITQKKFRWTLFGGFRKADIKAYLEHLSREWAHMTAQKKDLKAQLAERDEEINRLKQVEAALLDQLNDYSKTRQKMLEDASKEAQFIVAKGQMKAEKIVEEAEKRSRMMLEDANLKYRDRLEALRKKISHMEHIARSADEHAAMFIDDIMHIIDVTTERVAVLSNSRKQAPWLTDEPGREAKEEEPAVRVVSNFGKAKTQSAPPAEKVQPTGEAAPIVPPPGVRNRKEAPAKPATATATPTLPRPERASADGPTWHFDNLI